VNAESQPVPIVCRCLRSKNAGVVYGEPVRWESGFHPSGVFWCLQTAEPIGPDDGFVHPHNCTSARACWLTPD
jgi:hypothetical protein